MEKQMKKRRLEQYFYALILAVFPMLHVTKGIDFTDSGYSIMLFQNSGRYFEDWMLSTFLANKVGAGLMKLPGGDTYIGIKIYCLLILCVTVLGIYLFLSEFFSYRYVFLGMVIALCVRWCPGVVLYNYLSYFLFYSAVILIVYGCKRNKCNYFFGAGVILGLNIFTRLPNITQVILIVPIVFWYGINKEKLSNIIKIVAICVFGFLVGIGILGSLIVVQYGGDAYWNMLRSLITLSNEQDGYSRSQMLTVIWNVIFSYRKWLIYFGCIILLFILTERCCRTKWLKYLNAILAMGVTLLWLRYAHYWGVFSVHDYTNYNAVNFFMVLMAVISVVLSVCILVFSKYSKDIKMMSLINLCILFIAPLGTNTGFQALINNMYFVAPVTLGIFGKIFSEGKKDSKLSVKAVFGMLLFITLAQSLLFSTSFVYGDMNAKDLNKKIENNETLKGVQVLEGMEPIISGITEYVYSNNLREKECITFGNIPLMAFALDMPTAISTSWPDLNSYSIDNFEKELNLCRDKLPPVILNRWYFFGKDIFDEAIQKDLPKTKILADYLTDCGYEISYKNDKFLIYECK